MGEEKCKDCIQAIEVENLKGIISDMKATQIEHEKRITSLERTSDTYEEKFKTLFNTIDEIKKTIDGMSVKLDMLINKPAENWDNMIKTAIAVIVTAGITYLITK